MSTTESRITDGVVREKLPNGVTLLVKENHAAPVAALYVHVAAGYFHEEDRVGGIAHVIEHLMFKGTPRRPEREQVAREVRDMGGIVNAGTYYEETSYYITAPSPHFAHAADVLADMVRNPLFDADELAKEIEVIVQESLMKRDNPTAMLVESLYELANDEHRIRRWRIGHPEVLRAMRSEDLREFWNATYAPENIVVSVVGDVDTETVLAELRRLWGDMPAGNFRRGASPIEPPHQGFRYRRMTGDTKQRLLLFTVPVPPTLHPDSAALSVLSQVLSDGRSARLYRRLKEELQLANTAWAGYESFDDFGVFTLGAESIGDDLLPVETALWAEVGRLKRELISGDELERIKTRIEMRRLSAQEEVSGVARNLASYESLGDYRLMDSLFDQLRDVTAEDVRRVANVYFDLSQAALLEYLPASLDAPDYPQDTIETALREGVGANFDAIPPMPAKVDFPSDLQAVVPTKSLHESMSAKAIPLPNGALLYFKERRDLPLVSLSVLFKGGKRNENRDTAGLTNLMLKAALKGTHSFTAAEIANRIEGLGSGIGVSLAPDYFGFGVKLKRDVLEAGFRIFSEVVTAPTFAAAEIEKEKQALYSEIRRQQDNNASLAMDLFLNACYGDSHPYGLPGIGIAESIETFTPENLRGWHTRHVTAPNAVFGLVGDLSEAEAVALLSDLPLLANGTTQEAALDVPTPAPGERSLARDKKQTAAAMGWRGVSVYGDDRYAFDVLAEIASGMGGRFFRSVRGENSLAYQVAGFHRARRDAGNFLTYVSTAPENEAKAREILLVECAKLAQEPVTPVELTAAKASLLGEHTIGSQTFGAQAGELAGCAVYGLAPDAPQHYLARVQTITAEEVQAVAARYLLPDQWSLGVMRGTQGE